MKKKCCFLIQEQTSFQKNIQRKITEEVLFQDAEVFCLCEELLVSSLDLENNTENPLKEEKVRDHDYLSRKHRGAAHDECNLNCKQKSSSYIIFKQLFYG